MEDDDHGRKSHRSSCRRHCEQARRFIRVSSSSPLAEIDDDEDSYKRPSGKPQPEVSNLKNEAKKRKSEEDRCDEFMLQNLHKLKRFIRRVWNYTWCYTQYCYPGLRTSEYYKKMKRVCHEREIADKDKRKSVKKGDKMKYGKSKFDHRNPQIEPAYLSSSACGSLVSDSSTQSSDGESDLDGHDDTSDVPNARPLRRLIKPLKILPALEEELGWGQSVVKRSHQLSQKISNIINQNDDGYPISTIIKVACFLLAPAVLWLGVNYAFVKWKYTSLSGKLRRVKEENDLLMKESSKVESMLSSTEKLKMPFSTKESRQQVVAEFTQLAESRMKSKKEISRMTTEKQALLEELKTAKRLRDVARNQYSSVAEEVETNLPYYHS